MTTYYIDSGASGADDGTSWTDAWSDIPSSVSTTSGNDIVLIHKDHTENNGGSGDYDISLESNNPGAHYVRVDKDSGDAYDNTDATYNVATTGGAWEIDIFGAGLFHGLRFDSAENLSLGQDIDSFLRMVDCWFRSGAADSLDVRGFLDFENCTFLTTDSANSSIALFTAYSCADPVVFRDCTFSTGFEYRDKLCIVNSANSSLVFIGCDFSSFTRNPTSLLDSQSAGPAKFIDCKLPPNYQVFSSSLDNMKRVEFVRCNGTDEIEVYTEAGSYITESSIIRTAGADNSLELTTNAFCGVNNPVYSPWIYGVADAAESKTFDIYYTSSTRLDESELFIELEFLDSATTPYGTAVTSRKYTVLGDTVGNHATGGTWENASGETYKEYIRVTETIGVADSMVRARVGIAKTSQADEVYIDPYIEIS